MKKILVIEDENNIRFSVTICLEQAGYIVVMAEDGLVGLQKALEVHPDLILLDLILPKMNGHLLCEALKNEEATRYIPVVIMSAKTEDDDIRKAKEAGADDYIIKPFTPSELRNRIKEYLD